jgi:hypothetical protein
LPTNMEQSIELRLISHDAERPSFDGLWDRSVALGATPLKSDPIQRPTRHAHLGQSESRALCMTVGGVVESQAVSVVR